MKKITEKNIGKEYLMLSPVGNKKKSKVYGVFCVKSVDNGVVSGDIMEYIMGSIDGKAKQCKWMFDTAGHSIDEGCKRTINGFILNEKR